MTIEPQYAQESHDGEPLTEKDWEYLRNNLVRPESFTATNWKSGADRDKWKNYHEQFGSAKHLAEWMSVLSDRTNRKAAIVHIDNYNREQWLRRVGDKGLYYRDIRVTAPYDGFAHEFRPVDQNDPERITYAVISDNKDIADKMEEAELEMDGFEKHDTVGELLGFPECCRNWFWENWGDLNSTEKWVDPMYEIACNTDSAETVNGDRQHIRVEEPYPELNPLYRYWGYGFTTHMPCSFTCKQSRDIGHARGEIMSENGYGEVANAMYNWANLPMIWESRLGIARVTNKHWIGSANSSGYWSMKRIIWREEHDMGSVVDD